MGESQHPALSCPPQTWPTCPSTITTAPAVPLTRTHWPLCRTRGLPLGPWLSPTSTRHPRTPTTRTQASRSWGTAMAGAVPAVSTVKVRWRRQVRRRRPRLPRRALEHPPPCPCLSPTGSRSSGSNRSGSDRRKEKDPKAGDSKSGGSGSESDHTTRSSLRGPRERAPSERSGPAASEHSHRSHHSLASSLRSHHTHPSYGPPGVPPLYGPPMLMMPPPPAAMGPPGAPPGRDLASVPPELTASRQSFRMAMGNPSEFFVDVM